MSGSIAVLTPTKIFSTALTAELCLVTDEARVPSRLEFGSAGRVYCPCSNDTTRGGNERTTASHS